MYIQTFMEWIFSLQTTIINSRGRGVEGGRISSFSPGKSEMPTSQCPGRPTWMGNPRGPIPRMQGTPTHRPPSSRSPTTARKSQPVAFDPRELTSSASTTPISWTRHSTGRGDGPGHLDPQLLEEVAEAEVGLCAQPAPACAAVVGPWEPGQPSLPAAQHLPTAPCSTWHLSCGSRPSEKLRTRLTSWVGWPAPGQGQPQHWGHSTAEVNSWGAAALEMA